MVSWTPRYRRVAAPHQVLVLGLKKYRRDSMSYDSNKRHKPDCHWEAVPNLCYDAPSELLRNVSINFNSAVVRPSLLSKFAFFRTSRDESY